MIIIQWHSFSVCCISLNLQIPYGFLLSLTHKYSFQFVIQFDSGCTTNSQNT